MIQECISVTGTVLFREKIPNIKPKRHLRETVILSAEMMTSWLH